MRIKSYYAHAVEDAVNQARQELGPEAMLMNSRKTTADTRHLGEYEVVFGVLPAEPEPEPKAMAASAEVVPDDRLGKELADLKRQLEGMRRTLARSASTPSHWPGQAVELAEAYALLTASDVPDELAQDLVEAASHRLSGPRYVTPQQTKVDARELESALSAEMQSRLRVEPTMGRPGKRPAVVALVGPPGTGKTTTLVKLAVNYGLTGRRPAVLLSTDTYRVAAAEQLRYFAGILGLQCQTAETVHALAQELEEHSSKDLILIDTPGLGYSDMDAGAELARFLATRPDIDTHLVLAASMKAADLRRVSDAYAIFKPDKLIFTRLDETSSLGSLYSEAVRTAKPVSFLTSGQRIPEDMEVAACERLVAMVLKGSGVPAVTAA